MTEASALPRLEAALAAATPLAERFRTAGYRLYLVGGIVRDAVLDRAYGGADLDCTTDARPDQVKELVKPVASAVWAQGERFGTIGCVVRGQTYEITTHRAETYHAESRKPTVVFGDEITADLARRDFTVNAMAVDILEGTLVDPHGGCVDLDAAILRTPLDPDVSFRDDPLRMLRAARFAAAYDLEPDDTVIASIRELGHRMEIVSAERIRDELQKLLLLDDATAGFALLAETGLVGRVLPDHAADEATRLGAVVAAVVRRPAPRWAALFVDHPDRARPRLQALRAASSLIAAGAAHLDALEVLAEAAAEASTVRRLADRSAIPIDDAIEFVRAVRAARSESVAAVDAFAAALAHLRTIEAIDEPEPPLDGEAVMALLGIGPGPHVGQALDHLRELRYEHGPLTAAAAADAVERWWSEQ